MYTTPVDAKLDLILKRELAVPVSLVWRGLTEPELLKQWFCPKPWFISDCRVDLRRGGEFYFVMQDPDGELYPNSACLLEVEKEKRLIWTSQLCTDYRPAPPAGKDEKPCAEIPMTAIVSLTGDGEKTHYTAHVMHNTEAYRLTHEEMGFHDGWGTTIMQLEDLLKQITL